MLYYYHYYLIINGRICRRVITDNKVKLHDCVKHRSSMLCNSPGITAVVRSVSAPRQWIWPWWNPITRQATRSVSTWRRRHGRKSSWTFPRHRHFDTTTDVYISSPTSHVYDCFSPISRVENKNYKKYRLGQKIRLFLTTNHFSSKRHNSNVPYIKLWHYLCRPRLLYKLII